MQIKSVKTRQSQRKEYLSMSKLYKAEKELSDIINHEVWIELKKNYLMFNFIQKIKGMTIYKVLHENSEYVFASKYQKGPKKFSF